MKRLIKKAFGVQLYHGTTMENLEQITEMGMIMPQESAGAGIDVSNENEAKQRAFNRLYNEGIKPDSEQYEEKMEEYLAEEMEVEKRKFEGFTFFTDKKNMAIEYSGSTPSVVIEVSLPESSLMADDNDCPDCKDWEESLAEVWQVKVVGPITEDYIEGVHITNENGESIFYPKLTLKDQYQKVENASL